MTHPLFYDEVKRHDRAELARRFAQAGEDAVLRAICAAEQGDALTEDDYIALLSPAAAPHLERMAEAAHTLTRRNFGRAIQLFTPLYLANYCTNRCVYCGFNTGNDIARRKLSMEEIDAEGAAIAATGLRHILLLTGDAPKLTGPEYIADAARVLRKHMPGISVEVYSLTEEEYALLAQAGVDGMTMFQETYNEELYAKLHPAGPKRDFRFRLDAPDRAGQAKLRSLNVGALLGLDDWRMDSFFTGLHARWLQCHYPAADIALSVPRMRPHVGVFDDVHPVSDRDLVQIITAARLFLPTAGIVVSSRESAQFRDRLMRIAVTRVSAGVSTAVGGHAGAPAHDDDSPQFDIADPRSPAQMSEAIRALGLSPVFKYWEPLEGESFSCGCAPFRKDSRA